MRSETAMALSRSEAINKIGYVAKPFAAHLVKIVVTKGTTRDCKAWCHDLILGIVEAQTARTKLKGNKSLAVDEVSHLMFDQLISEHAALTLVSIYGAPKNELKANAKNVVLFASLIKSVATAYWQEKDSSPLDLKINPEYCAHTLSVISQLS